MAQDISSRAISEYGQPALVLAADRLAANDEIKRSCTELVTCLLNAGADANVQDSHGVTALHHACCSGQLLVVRKLLQNNANIHVRCNLPGIETPLQEVFYGIYDWGHDERMRKEYIEILKELLNLGANPNEQSIKIVLRNTPGISKERPEIIELLKRHGMEDLKE